MKALTALRRWWAGPVGYAPIDDGRPGVGPEAEWAGRRADLVRQGEEEAKTARLWGYIGATATSDDAILAVAKAAMADGWSAAAIARGLEAAYKARSAATDPKPKPTWESLAEVKGWALPQEVVHGDVGLGWPELRREDIVIPEGVKVEWHRFGPPDPDLGRITGWPSHADERDSVPPTGTSVEVLGLGNGIGAALRLNGVGFVETLERLGREGRLRLNGIGAKSNQVIEAALEAYHNKKESHEPARDEEGPEGGRGSRRDRRGHLRGR